MTKSVMKNYTKVYLFLQYAVLLECIMFILIPVMYCGKHARIEDEICFSFVEI